MRGLDQSERNHQNQHRRPTIADQWQRHPDYGRKPHDHRHVDRKEQKERDSHAHRHKGRKAVFVGYRGHNAERDDQSIQDQKAKRADKSEFFGQSRKDKIRVFFG